MSSQDQSSKTAALLVSLVNDAKNVLSDGHVSFGEVVSLGGSLAGKANQFLQLSGLEKRELVLKAVDQALCEILEAKGAEPSEISEKASWLADQQKIKDAAEFAKSTLPSVLDLAVDVARGKIDLTKPKVDQFCSKLSFLMSLCVSRQAVVEPKRADPPGPPPKEETTNISQEPAPQFPETNKDEKTSPAEAVVSE
jgi:hypothetical protein